MKIHNPFFASLRRACCPSFTSLRRASKIGIVGIALILISNSALADWRDVKTASDTLQAADYNRIIDASWDELAGDIWRATGSVGIGTTAPSAALDIVGNLEVGGTDFFVDDSAGRVGIGTTAPASELDVFGTATATTFTDGTFSVSSGAITGATTAAIGTSTTTPLVIGGTGTTSDLSLQTTSGVGATGADMHFLVGSAGATEAMTILNNGNVGIGTTSPLTKLSIQGTAGTDLMNVALPTTGASALYVAEDGKVGIGTTMPDRGLHILKDAYGQLRLEGTSSSKYGGLIIENDNANIGYFGVGGSDHSMSIIRNSFFLSSTEDIIFYTDGFSSGKERMVITDNGNIGIGTTSPLTKLSIQGTAGTDLMNVALPTTGASALYVAEDGNVGIGTTNPSTPLNVVGSVFPVGKFERTSTSAFETKGALGMKHTTTNNMIDGFGPSFSYFIEDNAGVENAIASISAVRDGADNTGAIAFKPYLAGVATEVMRVEANGNVGIGTGAPLQKLQVAGDIVLNNLTSTTGLNNALFVYNTDSGGWDTNNYGMTLGFDGDTNWRTMIFAPGNHDIAFSFHSTGVAPTGQSDFSEKVTIKSSGNVGIGTDSPATLLSLYKSGVDNSKLRITGDQNGGGTQYADLYVNEWSNLVIGGNVDNVKFGVSPKTGDDVSFTFGNNNDFGIGYSDSQDNLQFIDGNTTNTNVRMVIDNSGNVGIGVTDPDTTLEIYKVGTQLKLSGGAADYATFATADDGALTITTVDVDAAEGDIILSPDGNVGIGTDSPGARLHLKSSGGVSSGILVETTGTGASGYASIDYLTPTGEDGFQTGMWGSNNGDRSDYAFFYNNTINGGILFATQQKTRMLIDKDGNIGIGTTSPLTKLSIEGTAGTDLLNVALPTTGASALYVAEDGSVGIGTTSPRTMLEIFNTKTETGDLPGGLNSEAVALILKSDPSAANSRPGIVQYGLRTAGGIAYSINTAYIGSSEANVTRAATMGVYGNVGESSHTVKYLYLDSRSTGAYNNATLKIDQLNRVGIGISGNTRPSGTLHVSGTTYLMDGNVGIGTTSPTAQLHTKGNLTTALTGTVSVTISTTAVTGASTVFESELAVGDSIKIANEVFTVSAIASDTALTIDSAHSAGASAVTAYTDPDLFEIDNGDAVAKLVVDNSGNVGIGTTAPGRKLYIIDNNQGLTESMFYLESDDGPSIYLSDTAEGDGWRINTGSSPTRIEFIAYTNEVEPSGGDTKMAITNQGNVGIGTTSPTAQLHTKGNLTTALTGTVSVTISTTAVTGASTVFESELAVGDSIKIANEVFTVSAIASDTALTIDSAHSAGASAVTAYTDPNLFALDNGDAVSKVTVTKSGNVGVGTTGPSQELDLIGDLELENTTSADTGVIYKGANRFIHNFQHPTGDTAIPSGQNTFIGVLTGNFTMGSTATQIYHGSYNSAMGMYALYSNTTGYYNSAMGRTALYSNTTGNYNSAMGVSALYSNTTGSYNSAMGVSALYSNTTGYYNSAVGMSALRSNTTGSYNSAMGEETLYSNTTGNYNTALGMYVGYYNETGSNNTIVGYNVAGDGGGSFSNNSIFGYQAGRYISTGSNNILLGYQSGDNLTTGNNNIIIGYDIDARANNSANTLNIGNLIFGTGIDGTGTTLSSGNVGIGTTAPTAQLHTKGTLSTALTGTIAVTTTSADIVGTTTAFDTELAVGDSIKIESEIFTVSTITDATHLALDTAYAGSTASGLTAYSDPNLFALDNGDAVSKVTVTKSGNVGVGTTAPSQKLHVLTSNQIAAYFDSNNIGATRIGINSPAGTANTGLGLYIEDVSKWSNAVYQAGSGNYDYTIWNDQTDSVGLLLDGDTGNVGIGTTAPSEELEVSGDILASGTITNDSDVKVPGVCIWAEESGTLSAGLVFSFGNGGTGNWGVRQPASGTIVAMSLQQDDGTAADGVVQIAINGTAQGASYQVNTANAADGGNYSAFGTPLAFSAGDALSFSVTSVPTTAVTDVVMAMWVVYD